MSSRYWRDVLGGRVRGTTVMAQSEVYSQESDNEEQTNIVLKQSDDFRAETAKAGPLGEAQQPACVADDHHAEWVRCQEEEVDEFYQKRQRQVVGECLPLEGGYGQRFEESVFMQDDYDDWNDDDDGAGDDDEEIHALRSLIGHPDLEQVLENAQKTADNLRVVESPVLPRIIDCLTTGTSEEPLCKLTDAEKDYLAEQVRIALQEEGL